MRSLDENNKKKGEDTGNEYMYTDINDINLDDEIIFDTNDVNKQKEILRAQNEYLRLQIKYFQQQYGHHDMKMSPPKSQSPRI